MTGRLGLVLDAIDAHERAARRSQMEQPPRPAAGVGHDRT